MVNMRTYLELMGKSDNLRTELNRSKREVSSWSKAVRNEFSSLRNLAGSLQGQLAALGVSFGVLRTMADSARLDKSLTRTKQTLRATAEEAALLRRELFTMGRQTGQPLEELQSGLDTLAAAGLNAKESIEALKAINIGSAVTGAQSSVLGSALTTGASIYKFDLSKPGTPLAMLDQMRVASVLANAELNSLADIFSRIGVDASSAGMGFAQTLAYVEGLSLIQKQPEKLGTLADSTLRLFTNSKYMKTVQKATGVRFFDAKGGRREAFAILDDLKKKHDTLKTDAQRQAFYSKVVGQADLDTQKGFKMLMDGDYLAQMKKFEKSIAAGAGTLLKELPEAANNLIDQIGMLKNDLREAADGFVKPMNKTLGSWIKWARESKENGGAGLDGEDMIKYGVGGGSAALLLGRYGGKAAGRLFSGAGGLAAGTVTGKAMEEFAGVTPVFVVNMPGNFSGGAATATTGGPGRIGAALQTVGAASGGYAIGTLLNEGMGMVSDKLTDGKYGGEGWLGSMIYDWIHEKPEVKNEIKMNVTIDGNDRVTTSSDDPNTKATVKPMRRGNFGDANYF
jgi:TP901 family phage tail tape measure protein